MEASAGLVAGSHNRNELVVIRREGESGVRVVFSFFFLFVDSFSFFFLGGFGTNVLIV